VCKVKVKDPISTGFLGVSSEIAHFWPIFWVFSSIRAAITGFDAPAKPAGANAIEPA
jgi:hypothetical protein